MSTTNKLKAFVRYDGKKNIVPGTLILQAKAPKVGTWYEVATSLCCGDFQLITVQIQSAFPIHLVDFVLACDPGPTYYFKYTGMDAADIVELVDVLNTSLWEYGKFTLNTIGTGLGINMLVNADTVEDIGGCNVAAFVFAD